MSPDLEHALALWRPYDLAVIESKRADAVAAVSRGRARRKGSRVLTPEQMAAIAAGNRAGRAWAAARDAFARLGLVFDESPNETSAVASPADPPAPVHVGTREPVTFRTFGGSMALPTTPASCYRRPRPGE